MYLSIELKSCWHQIDRNTFPQIRIRLTFLKAFCVHLCPVEQGAGDKFSWPTLLKICIPSTALLHKNKCSTYNKYALLFIFVCALYPASLFSKGFTETASHLLPSLYDVRSKNGSKKPSYKFDNRRLYQKSRIGELPHFCNVSEKVQSIGDVCILQTRSVFRQCQLHCLK